MNAARKRPASILAPPTSETPDPAGTGSSVENPDLAGGFASNITSIFPVKRPMPRGLLRVYAMAHPLGVMDGASWRSFQPPAQDWVLDEWLPASEAALLTGAGAVGKSLIAQQLAACVASGTPFLGRAVTQAPALYVTCEDSTLEVMRRQRAIELLLGVDPGAIDRTLFTASWKGQADVELAVLDKSGHLVPTQRLDDLREFVDDEGISFIVLDNLSHLFGGDENVKRHVAAFCSLMNALACGIDGAVLMLGHPNKAGVNDSGGTGNQYGGSVAWENQIRSRMFMAADPDDPDARLLTNPKANYSPKGGKIAFRWHQGAFARLEDIGGVAGAELAATIAAAHDNAAFLDCLDVRLRQHRAVSENKASRTYAPKEFATMPESRGIGQPRLEAAMERLYRLEQVERGYLWTAHRKPVEGLRRASMECGDLCGDVAATECGDVRRVDAATCGDTHPLPTGELGAAAAAAAPAVEDERDG